jgi:hypothetical protein
MRWWQAFFPRACVRDVDLGQDRDTARQGIEVCVTGSGRWLKGLLRDPEGAAVGGRGG